ncbi:MAG TPA: hypothetical protein PLO37_16110 [Candidatus Hydrogenedentes bacterium]|nr:hypothetical protein [Candidatus Hydrogenedentota bacterium]HPG68370.1 hypothetical protein [Candidatus Hydrogenedentota bacterium]
MICTWRVGGVLAVCAIGLVACSKAPSTGVDDKLSTVGEFEVTAELAEIRGEFVNKPMYDYAFVMKYKVLAVHRGTIDGECIYIGHYNPLKPRSSVADARVPEVGGDLDRFRVGDVHRMALDVPIDDCYMGGIINRYFGEDTGPVYWAVWTNRASRP